MSEVQRIQDQLLRAFEGEAWHGPSVLRVLDGVDAKSAAAHPITSAHSIWELMLHIAGWNDAGRRRLAGDRAQLTDAEDWPSVSETTEAAWQGAKAQLIESHRQLLEAISRLDESRLDEPIIDDPSTPFSTVYVTLHGIVQHDIYHAGQIALLKKVVLET